jgi:hypothetical protein
MFPAPLLGVLLHAICGFAAGSFHAPLKKAKRWAWECFCLVMGLTILAGIAACLAGIGLCGWASLLMLIGSTMVIGYGNFLAD